MMIILNTWKHTSSKPPTSYGFLALPSPSDRVYLTEAKYLCWFSRDVLLQAAGSRTSRTETPMATTGSGDWLGPGTLLLTSK